jgi:hypothetical protein
MGHSFSVLRLWLEPMAFGCFEVTLKGTNIKGSFHRAVQILPYLHLTWRYMLFLRLFRGLPAVICFMYFVFLCLNCSLAQMAVVEISALSNSLPHCVVDVCAWKCQMNVEIAATLLMPSLDKFATDRLTLRVKGKGISYMSFIILKVSWLLILLREAYCVFCEVRIEYLCRRVD